LPVGEDAARAGGVRRTAEVVVAGHVCLDVIPALDEPAGLEPGRLVFAGPASLSTGGAVANVGLALHRLGVPVRLLGKVGNDVFGRAFRDALRDVDPRLADGTRIVDGEDTSYSIVFSPPGTDRTFVHCPGANDTFAADDVGAEHLAGARILHFGYPPLMRRMYEDEGAGLLGLLLRARTAGLVTSLDLCEFDPHSAVGRVDWAGFLGRVLTGVDIFAPSLGELTLMLDGRRMSPSDVRLDRAVLAGLAERAIALGASVVMIKLGDKGLYLRTTADLDRLARMAATLGVDDEAWRAREVLAPCFEVRSVAGTTGSGDATIAGLLAALLRGEDPVAAATSAAAVGAYSVEAPDATGGIRPWSELRSRLAGGWPRSTLGTSLVAEGAWHRDENGTLFDPEEEETS
jgi:sugar/nucleoside kinase (ribokinase family)